MSFTFNFKALSDGGHWIRLLLMLLFFIILHFSHIAIRFLAIAQAIVYLCTNKKWAELQIYSKQLTEYIYQINQFITYQSEKRPFPFGPWPN